MTAVRAGLLRLIQRGVRIAIVPRISCGAYAGDPWSRTQRAIRRRFNRGVVALLQQRAPPDSGLGADAALADGFEEVWLPFRARRRAAVHAINSARLQYSAHSVHEVVGHVRAQQGGRRRRRDRGVRQRRQGVFAQGYRTLDRQERTVSAHEAAHHGSQHPFRDEFVCVHPVHSHEAAAGGIFQW
jgi:hypothetical protein